MKDRALFTELGLYYPSFFRMELPFEYHDVPMEIYRLSPQKRGAFIHEYIHFLQDITTHFGMNNTYVCAEYLHSTINQIYKKNKKKIKIPINPVTNTDNVLLKILKSTEFALEIQIV